MRRTSALARIGGVVAVTACLALSACGPSEGTGPGDVAGGDVAGGGDGGAAPTTEAAATTVAPAPDVAVSWYWDDATSTYLATGAAPECPSPLVDEGALLDLGGVQSKLIPGQVRDGEYLVNGTFRWSSQGQPYPETVTVTMPFDGYVTGAWQFLKSGAYLFGLNLVHPCGLMLRLSKMHDPSPEVRAEVLDGLGEARERDSRETFYRPGVWLAKGTVLATSVGIPPSPSTPSDVVGAQLDVAILDLRARNPQIPEDFDFQRWSGSAAPQYVHYARCFYEGGYFSASEEAAIVAIPRGGGGPESDTCTGE